jgi:phospholipase D1/2
VTAILQFQKLTVEAMYSAIDTAIKQVGSSKLPTDYLQFMCLAQRVAGTMEGPNEGGKGKAGIMSHRHRRFMIYVHSKLMIVDDDVALIGTNLKSA